ncbi:hypothetical protein Cri9333_0599 [Crinalium epipsammum PCC 9333]|uniref:Uncharacterized protein n=1 Tax=Crinalium epipsammum PCC 9333 TaxID=1173022 RepID=K9VVH8_9CYAN|nr:hypothetical protein [Crinalium epipsammum]AFZ11544.1 hypothetical protein Cri9333_0599 [Crinalium epipsammum PCC 9333]
MLSPDRVSISIDEVFTRIKNTLLHTWSETGFGQISIESERIKANKIRVIVRGSTHYCYVISDEDVNSCKEGG